MISEDITRLVKSLTEPGPLTAERFAALLGAPLKEAESNPSWQTLTFELAGGPFTTGEVRLKATGDGALLILEPRNPPGLGRAEVDPAALGARLGMEPNPRIPPAGVVTEYFQKGGVQVAAEWTSGTDRLRSLVLKWLPPGTAAAERTLGTTAGTNPN